MPGLIVRIGGDWTGLKKSLGEANRALKTGFGQLGIAAGSTALVAATKAAIDYADEIAKGAKRTGIASDEYQRLAYAAQLSGTSVEGLATGFKMLQRALGDTKPTEEVERAFRALGLSIADLRKQDATQQFLTVARALAEVPPGAEKTALALDLLGRSGSDLLPMLEGGAAGFDELRQKIEQAGGVMTKFQLETAEQFNDTMTQAQTGGKKLIVSMVGIYAKYWDIIGKAAAFLDPSDASGKLIRAQNKDLIEQSKSGDALRQERRNKEKEAKLEAIRSSNERAEADKKAAAEAEKAEKKRQDAIKKTHATAVEIMRDLARERQLAEITGADTPVADIAEGMRPEDLTALGGGDPRYGLEILRAMADAQEAADEAALDAAEKRADAQEELNDLQQEYADTLKDIADAERDRADDDYLEQLRANAQRAKEAVDNLRDALRDAMHPQGPDVRNDPNALANLAKDPRARRDLRKKNAEDDQFNDKLDRLAKGERVHLTPKEKRRLKALQEQQAGVAAAQGQANVAANQLEGAIAEAERNRMDRENAANLKRLEDIQRDMATIAKKARGEE